MPYANPTDQLASSRRSYERNKDKVLATHVRWRAENPDKQKEYSVRRRAKHLLAKYGMVPEDYDRLLASQGGACAICNDPTKTGRFGRLHIDHCHKTGKVRGLLCSACNQGIGLLREEAGLRAALSYLGGNNVVC